MGHAVAQTLPLVVVDVVVMDPVTFALRGERPVELPSFAKVATRQTEEKVALDFVTTQGLTVHGSRIVRVMAVKGGARPVVRELPYSSYAGHSAAMRCSPASLLAP